MKILAALTALMLLLIGLPIWLFLMYFVLKMVGATELMWFLFWIYVPVTIIGSVMAQVIRQIDLDD